MPKDIQSIKQFDGGLNTFSDAKDITEKESANIANFDVKQVGRLKLLGTFKTTTDITTIGNTLGASTGPVTISGGEELLVYKTDTTVGNVLGDETWVVYLDRSTSQLLGLPLTSATWRKLGSALGAPFDGIGGLLATTSNAAGITHTGAFYVADGKLRACNTEFGQASFIGSSSTEGASSLWFGHIKRNFGKVAQADAWYMLPAVLQKPTTDTLLMHSDVMLGSGLGGPDVAKGKMGIILHLERGKGDGSIQMQGRTLYATYTYDGQQETLPVPIYTIDNTALTGQVPAPTNQSLGYIAEFQRTVEYGDTTAYIARVDGAEHYSVHDQAAEANDLENWESSGTFTADDDTGQIQTLSYTSISSNASTNITNISRAGTVLTVTATSHGLKVGDIVTVASTSESAYNSTTHEITAVTDADVVKITVADSGGSSSGGTITLNGSKIAGITGWVDSGFCSINYSIADIILTSGGAGYSSAPTVVFTGGNPTTAATAAATYDSTTNALSAITVTNWGDGYESAPVISFTGGGTPTTNATAEATITGKLSTESLCANKDGSWTASDIADAAELTYDPPGELESLDEKLGVRIGLTFSPINSTGGDNDTTPSSWGTQILDDKFGGARVSHVNFYTNKFDDDAGTVPKTGETDFAYIGTFDLVNGYRKDDGTYQSWAVDVGKDDQQFAYSTYYGSMSAETYQSRTGVFPDTTSLDIRWRTATVVNRRVYAGNVLMDDGTGTERHFPDRVMKSIPNAFDVFPTYDSLDVVVDDGDEIVLLETFGGKLLQFKTETLYIIDVTNEPEYLANTFRFRGIPSKASAAKADEGIVFANKHGVFMYNGEGVQQFAKGKIESTWKNFYDESNPPLVSFNPTQTVIIIGKTNSAEFLYYDFMTKSWTIGNGSRYSGEDKTRFISKDGEIYQGIKSTSPSGDIVFHKWIDDFPSGESITDTYKWESKEFDFGDSGQDSQIYNIKVTYRTKATGADVNGAFYLDYNTGTGKQANTLTGTFSQTDDKWWNAELKPTGGNLTCKSARIRFESTSSQELDYDFEINDISIIYRNKSVK